MVGATRMTHMEDQLKKAIMDLVSVKRALDAVVLENKELREQLAYWDKYKPTAEQSAAFEASIPMLETCVGILPNGEVIRGR